MLRMERPPRPPLEEADLRAAEAERSSVCGASLASAFEQWAVLSEAARAEKRGAGGAAGRAAAREALRDLVKRRRAGLRSMLRCLEEAEAAIAQRAAVGSALRHLAAAREALDRLRGGGKGSAAAEASGAAAGARATSGIGSAVRSADRGGVGGNGYDEDASGANELAQEACARLERWAAKRGAPQLASAASAAACTSRAAAGESGSMKKRASRLAFPGPRDGVRRAMAEAKALRKQQRALAALGVTACPLPLQREAAALLNALWRTVKDDDGGDGILADVAETRQRLAALFSPSLDGGDGASAGSSSAAAAAVAAVLPTAPREATTLPAAKRPRCSGVAADSSAASPRVAMFVAAAVAKEALQSALEAVAVRCRTAQEVAHHVVRTDTLRISAPDDFA